VTITIDLTPKQELRIADEARAAGIDPAQVVLRLIDDLHPRPDGKPWNECEGFE